MDDPLKRRMFAQQVMNMYNSRQPMGILASSPELMGAVQNYAGGGAVKGYQLGGVEGRRQQRIKNNPVGANFSLSDIFINPAGASTLTGGQMSRDRITKIDNTIPSNLDLPAETEMDKEITQEDKDKKIIKQQGEFGSAKENVMQVDDFQSDTQPKFVAPEAQLDDAPGKINQTTENILKPADDKPKDTKKSSFVTDVASSYEAFKNKLAKIDRRYEADDAKRTDYMQKIESLMEEEEDEISLEDVDKKAREVLDLKEGQYDDDRVTAFWMSMIKGGLATAAGESENALTNISKGLLFGVESFGKDLNQINQQEREDRKSLAKIRYDLMKDEKAAKIAERTLKIQAYGELAKLEENKFQFKTELEYKTARNKVLDELAFAKLDLTAAQTLQSMDLAGKTFDLKVEELALNKQKQKDYVKLTEKQLSAQLRDKASTKEIKNIYALGADYATYEDGQFTFTDKGKAMLIAATTNKTKFTDLVTTAKAVAANKKIKGYSYDTVDKAEDAYYYYEGITKPALEALVKTTKDRLGGIDNDEYRKQEKIILQQFAKDTGGTLDATTGGGSFRKMPQAVIDKNYNEGDTFTSNGIKYIVGPNNTFTEAN